jgi:carbon-monoxide dehydrogenase medium subunit
MYPTTFHKAKSIAHAVELSTSLENALFLSGGHTLIPTMKQGLSAPQHLIDITHVDSLNGIALVDNQLEIGATTRYHVIAQSSLIHETIPVLSKLTASIGDRQVRHRGTIGGSIANNDPAADCPAACLGLGATIVTNRREIKADDFFLSLFQTALQPSELIVKIKFPIPKTAGYAKFKSSAARYPVVGVFLSQNQTQVRMAITGAGAKGVFRAIDFEVQLNQNFSSQSIDNLAINTSNLLTDIGATAEYRANLIKVLAQRVIKNMNELTVLS